MEHGGIEHTTNITLFHSVSLDRYENISLTPTLALKLTLELFLSNKSWCNYILSFLSMLPRLGGVSLVTSAVQKVLSFSLWVLSHLCSLNIS